MVKKVISFLEASIAETDTTAATTTSNVFLDENGQFEDVSQVADNISSWWQEMDIIGTITTKLPTIMKIIDCGSLRSLVLTAGFISEA